MLKKIENMQLFLYFYGITQYGLHFTLNFNTVLIKMIFFDQFKTSDSIEGI